MDRPAGDGGISVVICDDHRVFADALKGLLDNAGGIKVARIALTEQEVVDAATDLKPDVVLMDYRLPDGDGVSATKRLKRTSPATKVVMLTSFNDDAVLVGAIEAGCSGFVTKHKAADEVISAVRLAAEGEALVSPDLLIRLLPRLRQDKRGVGSELTPRELEVLSLLAKGMSNKQIAQALSLASNTVRNHVQAVLMKLQAHSRLEAVAVGVREGLISR